MRQSARWPSLNLSVILLLVASLMIAIAFGIMTASSGESDITTRVVSKVHQRSLERNQVIRYPVFHEQALDAAVKEHIERQVKQFESETLPGSRLMVTFKITHYSDVAVSIEFTYSKQMMGQPQVSEAKSLIIDRKQKRPLLGRDIFVQTPSARLMLARLLHDYVKTSTPLNLSPLEGINILELSLDGITIVRLEAGAVVVRLPLTERSIEIAINKRLLGSIIQPAYLHDTTDSVAVESVAAPYVITERPAPPVPRVNEKMIALTFDDGPSAVTPALLDTLWAYESQATFFVLGHLVESHRGIVNRIIAEGNEIGNHSWNHPDLRFQTPLVRNHQIVATQQAIQAATGGYTPHLMRPPYGASDSELLQLLAEHHLQQSLWTVDTHDWRDRDSELIYQRIMHAAGDRKILLLHDIYPSSVAAAMRAIRDLKLQGYQLVTVSQMEASK